MRSGFAFVFLLTFVNCFAQLKDTVVLGEAIVHAAPDEKFLAGSTFVTVDSAVKKTFASQHLGETLSMAWPIAFRNYGNGMLSSISLRGTSPQQTAVLWNGININSFSLGQVDFSILPVSSADEIKVHVGGGSARFGSGAMGGTVLLNSSTGLAPIFKLTQEIGSFGRYFTLGQLAFQNKHWDVKAKFYEVKADNDFKILSTGQRQQHASYRQYGFVQDATFILNEKNTVAIHYWYHHADRDIQPRALKENNRDTLETQQDINHRVNVQYSFSNQVQSTTVSTSFVRDEIIYNHQPGNVSRWITQGRQQFQWTSDISTEWSVTWNSITGNIPQYENGSVHEDRFEFRAAVQKQFGQRLHVAANFSQPYIAGVQTPFLPYLGGEYVLHQSTSQRLLLRANISRNYRFPTLNDRYWINAGSKNLLPERSVAGETSIQWTMKTLQVDQTFFAQRVDQWIQWIQVPQEGQQAGDHYEPRNIKQVSITGFETRIKWQCVTGQIKWMPMVCFQHTSSVITKAPQNESYAVGNQLIYTPRQTGTASLQTQWRGYALLVTGQYNSRRFTDEKNIAMLSLDPFVIWNASIGKSFSNGPHQLDINVAIKNLANKNYTLYSTRALPGRNYSIQLSYQLNHLRNEK